MDGNLYLIKLVKKRPVLWNKTCKENRDSEARNVAWKEIAAIIGVEIDWIRSRWYNLRERFVKELKVSYSDKQKSKFKYFSQMLFLIKYVEFRKKPNTRIDIEQLQLSNKSRTLRKETANEFIITKKEIEESEDTDIDSDSIFMELECTETCIVTSERNANAISKVYLHQVCDSTAEDLYRHKQNIAVQSEKIIELPIPGISGSSIVAKADVEYACNSDSRANSIEKESSNSTSETRCEDTIFGELITAMLKKMNEAKKKAVKKEIINILLS